MHQCMILMNYAQTCVRHQNSKNKRMEHKTNSKENLTQPFIIFKIDDVELIQPMPFILIEAKGQSFKFQDDDHSGYMDNEKGIDIKFAENYYLCAYQCTQEFWEAVVNLAKQHHAKLELDPNPSNFKGKARPVTNVSWNDAQLFMELLNQLFKTSKSKFTIDGEKKDEDVKFSLPSETQWEYAAIAGNDFVYAGSNNLNDVAWYEGNNDKQTMPVGLKQANAWGLYDMSGNVWEWCQDDFVDDIKKTPKYGTAFRKDAVDYKSLRGGSFFDDARRCRSRRHFKSLPDSRGGSIGFRLLFSLSSAV